MSNQIKVVKELQDQIDLLIAKMKLVNDEILKSSKNANETSNAFAKIKTPSQLDEFIAKLAKTEKALEESVNEREKTEKRLLTTMAKKQQATELYNQAIIKERYETQQQNKLIKEATVISSTYSTLLQKSTAIRNQLARTIQDLNLKRKLGLELSNKEQKELTESTAKFNKYNIAIKSARNSVDRFQDSVGKYPKTLGSVITSVKSLTGALGLMGGAFLVATTLKDAFKRVREFDLTMQTLSGVLRTSRKDLVDLENTIISVAGNSVKTSNETAKLAESLITLGKSKEAVKLLLQPVTDLSIGLKASSDEAGEFLVQMLNSFGASDEEAQNYADTIASIRTSTSLDFQKMRDSFQYIAPISKILNKDLAETGALVGVLSDNGLKAESSGRLLATSFQRLASNGMTLEEALDQINKAQSEGVKETDLLAIATDLFGVQSAKVGITLANNRDRVKELTEEIRGNQGALDDLVSNQMESMDNKLKSLDSAYEELILTVDNGNGTMSKFFKSAIDGATDFLKRLKDIEKASEKVAEATGKERSFFDNFTLDVDYKLALALQKKFNKQNETIDNNGIESLKLSYNELNNELKTNTSLTESQKAVYSLQLETVRNAITLREEEKNGLVKEAIALGFAESKMGEYVKAWDLSTKQLNEWLAENREVPKALEDETKGLNGSTGAIEKRSKAMALSSDLEKERLRDLKLANEVLGVLKKNFKDDSSFDGLSIPQEDLDKMAEAIAKLDVIKNAQGEIKKEIQESWSELFGTIEDITGVSADSISNLFEEIKDIGTGSFESITDVALASLDVISQASASVYDGKIEGYERDIEANNDYYDTLIEKEGTTDAEIEALEKDRDAKNEELEKKKQKEQIKAFNFNKALSIAEIGINLAKTISAISLHAATLGLAGPAWFASNAPVAIGLAGVQTALVLSQQPPAFAEGGVMDHDGAMLINDHKSGRLEVVERDGKLLMTTKKNALVEGKKGDIIHKDANEYFKDKTDSELIDNIKTHSFNASLVNQIATLQKVENLKVIDSYKQHSDRIVKAIQSKKQSFVIKNNVSLKDELNYINRGNSFNV